MDLVDANEVQADWKDHQEEMKKVATDYHVKQFFYVSAKYSDQELLRKIVH